jgi:alkylation response protein AidB-like acyl-CoA dehydrogenase
MVLTESGGGSDLQAIKTRATLDSDGSWRISGSKQYISHGNGELLLVLAKSEDASSGMFGLSLFAVEGGNDNGVDVKGVERKMGLHGSPTCELQFNHSKAVLLGDRKFGLFHVVEILNQARFSVAAQGIGIATAAYYSAKDYANIRRAFNSYLHEIPAVSQLLKNMEVKLAASRALLYSGTQWIDLRNTLEHKLSKQKANKEKIDKVDQITLKEAQAMVNLLSPVAKYLSTEWANQICYDAQQIHGGSGYIKGTTVERCIRDVRITTIYEGTTQVLVGLAFKYVLNDVLKRQIDDFRNQSFPKPLGECQSALINAYANFKEACDIVNSESQNFKLAAAKDVTDLYGCIYAGILLITSAEPDNEENTICRIHCLETKALSLASLSRVQSKIWSTPSLHC